MLHSVVTGVGGDIGEHLEPGPRNINAPRGHRKEEYMLQKIVETVGIRSRAFVIRCPDEAGVVYIANDKIDAIEQCCADAGYDSLEHAAESHISGQSIWEFVKSVDCRPLGDVGDVAWRYGAAKPVPLWAVGDALLSDLSRDGTIPSFAEVLDVEDVPGVEPRLIPVYGRDGLRAGDLFAVVVSGSGRVGLSKNGSATWVKADTIVEALIVYGGGGQ